MSDPGTMLGTELTLDQFEQLPEEDAYRLELVRGLIVREPAPGERHGTVIARLSRHLDEYVELHRLGRVMSDVGVILSRTPATLRVPDLAFVSRARMNAEPSSGSLTAVPDLCVEVLSPLNRASDMQQKVVEYLDAGARLVWVIDPVGRMAVVHRSRSEIRILGVNEALDGDDVLPGFSLPLAKLFSV